MMDDLLEKVKQNLILDHAADDALLKGYITAAVSYAESYQHIPAGTYNNSPMPATTEQAVIMLSFRKLRMHFSSRMKIAQTVLL